MTAPETGRTPVAGGPRGHLRGHHVAWSLFVGVLVVGAAIAVAWAIARPYGHDEWADVIRSAVLAAGAIAAVPAGYVAYRKQQTTEAERHDTIEKEQQRRNELVEATARADARDYRERYAAASVQLGSGQAAIRLAGVYVLTQLADEWGRTEPDQRQVCIDVLCAYLRMPWPTPPTTTTKQLDRPIRRRLAGHTAPRSVPSKRADPREIAEETQVRATILRLAAEHLRRTRNPETAWWSNDFDLTGAARLPECRFIDVRLDGAFNARGATFAGDALFTDATFTEFADFEQATFAGFAEFSGPQGARRSLRGARFSKGASFSGATFCQDASFTRATFTETTSFADATFAGDAGFIGATFSRDARFEGARFSETAWFGRATFAADAGFEHANFAGSASFHGVAFSGDALFMKATFSADAEFKLATFSKSALFGGARFSGSTGFDDTTFSGAAGFGRATFSGDIGFAGAKLVGFAGFERTTFDGDVWFTSTTFTGTVGFRGTRFFGTSGFEGATFLGDAGFADVEFYGRVVTDSAIVAGEVTRRDGTVAPGPPAPRPLELALQSLD